eukprot:CAMPEP_0194447324 /NCGR_PEP_ID=MMETSP0176-20130528/128949_1 /TAXON_ID=216777 /ORGANISM="Proboscia alata, Strain PI-D3" /LENGTH=470 /DNA_ID=CAMNT_0039274169 /DNA_START=264 /DNA_END=1676 /DNA_ORIENTATION=-
MKSSSDWSEFDSILGEGGSSSSSTSTTPTPSVRTAVLTLPRTFDTAKAQQQVNFVSTAVVEEPTTEEVEQAIGEMSRSDYEAMLNDDFDESAYYQTEGDDQFVGQMQMEEYVHPNDRKGNPITEMFREGSYNALLFKVGVPIIFSIWGLSKAVTKVRGEYWGKEEGILQSYAQEMVYHDGDFEELRLCHETYRTKMRFFPGNSKQKMITAFLTYHAKKVTVSPKAISGLSYVFSLYKYTESEAAAVLVDVAESLVSKPASSGKLLFFGTRILKSKEAKAALKPIRKKLYGDKSVIDAAQKLKSKEAKAALKPIRKKLYGDKSVIDAAQKLIAESSYKATITAGGKEQTELTVGWEVLGLKKERAQEMYDLMEMEGFLTLREQIRGAGLSLDERNNLPDAKDRPGGEEVKEEEETAMAQECGQCGYTMFVAKGREFKFFGEGFVCPGCGAAKDQFVGRIPGQDADGDDDEE